VVCHALQFDSCANNVHEDNGQYSMAIHQFLCGHIPRWYLHPQQKLGRASKAHRECCVPYGKKRYTPSWRSGHLAYRIINILDASEMSVEFMCIQQISK
jgi:hypothetical protein